MIKLECRVVVGFEGGGLLTGSSTEQRGTLAGAAGDWVLSDRKYLMYCKSESSNSRALQPTSLQVKAMVHLLMQGYIT